MLVENKVEHREKIQHKIGLNTTTKFKVGYADTSSTITLIFKQY